MVINVFSARIWGSDFLVLFLRYDHIVRVMKKETKKLSTRDVVLGIGRKATDAELTEYLNRDRKDTFKPIQQVREEISAHMAKRNQSKKAS
jgi:hypothetical protein